MKNHKKTTQSYDTIFPLIIAEPEESIEIVDQDELQLKDEMSKEWVEAWRKEIKKDRKRNKRMSNRPHG